MIRRIIVWLDRVSFISICAMVFCLPFSAHVLKIFFYLGFVCLIVRKIIEYRLRITPLFKWTYLNRPMFIFILTMALSVIFSKDFYESQKVFFERILLYGGVFFLTKETVDSKKKIYILLGSISLSAFIIGVDAVWQYFKGFDLFFGYPKADPGVGKIIAISGPFGKYNSFSGYLELILPLMIFISWIWKKWYLSVFFCFLSVLLVFSSIYVFQRTTWVSVILSVSIISLWTDRKIAVIFIVSIILISFFVPGEVYQRVLGTFTKQGDSDRFIMWREAKKLYEQSIFIGSGLGSYARFIPLNMSAFHLHAHNTYLELLGETGILGLASFLYLLGIFLKRSFFAFFKITDKRKKRVLAGTAAACLSYFIAGLFSTNMIVGVGFPSMFWIIFTIAAVLPDISFDLKKQEVIT